MSKDLSRTHYCKLCKKSFHPYKNREGIFCSAYCSRKGRRMRETVYLEFICKWCGAKVKKPKYNTDKTTKYCSIQCMANDRGKNMSGKNHPKWKGGSNRTGSETFCKRIKIEMGKCEKCGQKEDLHTHHKIKVSDRPDLAKDKKNVLVLCKNCHAKEHPEYEGMLLKKKKGIYKDCQECKESFYVTKSLEERKFCSRKCQFESQKKGFIRKCKICNAEFYVKPSKQDTYIYCNVKCKRIGLKLK